LAFLLFRSCAHLDLHSFPTRRSSDLIFYLIDLPADLVVDRLLHELEAVQVLDLAPRAQRRAGFAHRDVGVAAEAAFLHVAVADADRKSTRLNSSHVKISYAVFCLKKK